MNVRMMSCCGSSMSTGRKIIMLSLGMGGLAFVALFFVKSPVVSLLFVIPPLLFCPTACGVVGGLLWLIARPSKSKEMNNE